MYRFKNILVPLENLNVTEDDVAYAGTIMDLAKSQKAYFINSASTLDIPEEIKKQYPELVEPVDEFAERNFAENIDKQFSGKEGLETKSIVTEGNILDVVLTNIVRKDIDLVISSKGNNGFPVEHFAEKLARKAPCSVLIVPEEYKEASYSKILVPVDFSEYSDNAFDAALAFAKAASINQIVPVHVYHVPTGYHKSGKSYEEFAEIMKHNAEEKFSNFIEKFDLGPVAVDPMFVLNENTVKGIMEAQGSVGADLIVLSTRGRTTGASMIMSSYAEKIIKESSVPVLAVKEKGAGLNFVKALLEL